MSLPREVIPGRFYLITRRCTQRHYLMRPDKYVNQAYEYCLAVAAQKFDIDIVTTCAMSNHHHTVLYDRFGTYPAFLEHFHKLFARWMNAYRKHKENFWSSEQVSVVRLVGANAVIAKLVYVALNPVAAHLVERVHQWPGVNSYKALLAQQPVTVERPTFFFRKAGKMPKSVTIKYVIPPELGDATTILRTVKEKVEHAEAEIREKRIRDGRKLLTRRGVMAQLCSDSPRKAEPRRDIRPTFAASNKWKRMEAIQARREFLDAYKQARLAWSSGVENVKFPPGTYWLKRFANVRIAT